MHFHIAANIFRIFGFVVLFFGVVILLIFSFEKRTKRLAPKRKNEEEKK